MIWGLFHGFFIVIERVGFNKILAKMWQPFQYLYTLLAVVIGWVFFRAIDLDHAFVILSKLFSFSVGDPILASNISYTCLDIETLIVFLLALIFSMPIKQHIFDKLADMRVQLLPNLLKYSALLILFILSLALLAVDSYNPFLYFRF